jgi:hypothetical protein
MPPQIDPPGAFEPTEPVHFKNLLSPDLMHWMTDQRAWLAFATLMVLQLVLHPRGILGPSLVDLP